MNIIKKLIRHFKRIIKNQSAEEANKQYLLEHGLQIGECVDCFSWNGIDGQYPGLIKIGDYTTIASNCKLLAHDAAVGYLTKSTRVGVIEIGSHCFIGAGTIILPNVRIGDWSIVGAGSIVTRDIPEGCVYAGNPAKFICTTDEYKQKHENNLKTYPVEFIYWRDVANYTTEDWAKLRNKLSNSYGYITTRDDIERK